MKTLNIGQARRLAKHMRRGSCSARVEKNGTEFVFSGPSGEFALHLDVSSLQRIIAHWQSFLSNNGYSFDSSEDANDFRSEMGARGIGSHVVTSNEID